MPKFNVTISYPVIMRCTYEIDAVDRQSAGELALIKAKEGDGEFDCETDSMSKPTYSVAEVTGAEGDG